MPSWVGGMILDAAHLLPQTSGIIKKNGVLFTLTVLYPPSKKGDVCGPLNCGVKNGYNWPFSQITGFNQHFPSVWTLFPV
jgi:hypothetical protein